ncbi:MAG TPA: hypothetical protein VNQ52_01820 [Microbacteriaceae bacterium]|nr:hypothetical protein [Microbacteriaceae bacterium]
MTATQPKRSRTATFSLYLVVGTLLAAAVLGAVLIIVGDQANVAGRAWLTLLLVAAFAGAVALDSVAANGPNRWYLAASTIVNVVLVAVGLNKLWNGWLQPQNTADPVVWILQIWVFLLIVVLLRVALLVTQLYWHFFVSRAKIALTRVTGMVALLLAWISALVLAIPLALPEADWADWWWRIAGAAALVAVVALVVPVVVRAFEPKPPKPQPAPQPIAVFDPRTGQYHVPQPPPAAPQPPPPADSAPQVEQGT